MPYLHWQTREEDLRRAGRAPYRLLDYVPELSAGDQTQENMIIQGDNLEALKALLPVYGGSVKCIYIDPPYNTGSAFEHYDDNMEHTLWLSMMYPRLELLHELLDEKGSIWVSIDDNEGHYMKVIMDEVFGRKNFISTIIWQKKYAPKADAKLISESHDFILVYAKDIESVKIKRLPKTDKQIKRYVNKDNDPRGVWKPGDVLRNEVRDYAVYPVKLPSGREVLPPPGTSWRYTKDKFAELMADNRIWFGVNGNSKPAIKRFLSEVTDTIPSTTIWTYDEVGHNDESKKESKELFGEELFGTPKPERLIERVFYLASEKGDLVLDSFLGSGTSAAVAHKLHRKYIGIEFGEQAVKHCMPRLNKVIQGEQGGISKKVNWRGGGGFRFFRLGEPIFDEMGKINPKVRFSHLASHVWFCETATPLVQKKRSPFLGVHKGTGYYLLFNGILGDRTPDGGNVLTGRVLRQLPHHKGPKVIYGEITTLGKARLHRENVVFKQIPYEIKAR